MPPNGYESVTMAASLLHQLDAIVEEESVSSRPDAIQLLIDEYKRDDDSIDYAEIERRCQRAVGAELEARR